MALKHSGKTRRRRTTALRRLRSLLFARSGKRCEVPWCRTRGRLDPHHLVKRSQGGGETEDNIVLLCRAHHEATDRPQGRGRLTVSHLKGESGFWFVADFGNHTSGGAWQGVPGWRWLLPFPGVMPPSGVDYI